MSRTTARKHPVWLTLLRLVLSSPFLSRLSMDPYGSSGYGTFSGPASLRRSNSTATGYDGYDTSTYPHTQDSRRSTKGPAATASTERLLPQIDVTPASPPKPGRPDRLDKLAAAKEKSGHGGYGWAYNKDAAVSAEKVNELSFKNHRPKSPLQRAAGDV